MDAVYLISGFISLVALICFFVLCTNVAFIKKKFTEKSTSVFWLADYNKQRYLKNQELAKTALQNYIWLSITEHKNKSHHKNLYEKYNPIFEEYNINFPDYPFVK